MRPAVTWGVALIGVLWLGAWSLWVPAQETNPARQKLVADKPVDLPRGEALCRTPAELAQAIDAEIARKWHQDQVKPADLSEDGEFLRRVYLDLTGRIPSVSEVRAFLDDPNPNKRAEWIRKLLDSSAFAGHWSTLLAETWISQADNPFFLNSMRAYLQSWLRAHLRRRTGYDKIVYELLTAGLDQEPGRPASLGPVGTPNPIAFYQANGFNPRNLAASVSRRFLGIQLDCAECHNHPFARWKRQQFWELAAFFAGMEQPRNPFNPPGEIRQRRTLRIPDTNITVTARFLDGQEPDWSSGESAREVLAKWLVSANNPYFAQAAVNRVWYQLLGYGLVDPPDDMHEGNPPSHPELLQTLAKAFAASGFDVQFVIEGICLSRTYQLSSRRSDPSQDDPRLFARRVVRRMTAAQLWDSLVQAAYWNPAESTTAQQGEFGGFNTGTSGTLLQRRQAFLEKFRDAVSRPVEAETSVLQALALMNGETTTSAIRLETSPMLQMIATYPWWDDRQRLEVLFLATLSRRPKPEEQARFLRHIQQNQGHITAWADVLWVVLNSPEFLCNH